MELVVVDGSQYEPNSPLWARFLGTSARTKWALRLVHILVGLDGTALQVRIRLCFQGLFWHSPVYTRTAVVCWDQQDERSAAWPALARKRCRTNLALHFADISAGLDGTGLRVRIRPCFQDRFWHSRVYRRTAVAIPAKA